MAKKQIKELIVGLLGEAEGKLITKKLFVTRDGLMHGGSIENIEKKVGLSIEELVNQIGYITNELLMHQFKAIAGEELVFGYISNSFVNKTLSASVNLMINSESHTYPSEEELSGIKISINSGFK